MDWAFNKKGDEVLPSYIPGLFHTLRIQVSPKEGISSGIGTFNPILGRCLDSQGYVIIKIWEAQPMSLM